MNLVTNQILFYFMVRGNSGTFLCLSSLFLSHYFVRTKKGDTIVLAIWHDEVGTPLYIIQLATPFDYILCLMLVDFTFMLPYTSIY